MSEFQTFASLAKEEPELHARRGLPLVLASSMAPAEILSTKHSSRAQNGTLDIFFVRCVLWLEERPHTLGTGIGRAATCQKPDPAETMHRNNKRERAEFADPRPDLEV